MEYEQVKEMVTLFNQSANQEMQLETEDVKLYLNKQPTSAVTTMRTPVEATPDLPTEEATSTHQPTVSESGTTIESPMVGSVYLQPAPDQSAYLTVGQSVTVGEVVCVIEAMKMMTEVKSTVAGVVTAVLVANEELVEYHQPLFEVKEG